jgi:carbon-monoxide dehydrogenase medium subunit
MIPQNFEYFVPANLHDALGMLADGSAKPLAGGMSLIPLMKLRLAAPERLVDLGRLCDLNYIHENGATIKIGATTTHYQVESSDLVRAKCPLLAETASNIGDVQVRNMGTIGGSTAHADPAADYPAALLALEAQLVLVGANSERTLGLADFFVDTFTTALEPGEIIREVIVPSEAPGTGVAYQKLLQPASGFAIVGIAARVRKTNGTVSFARVGVTGLSNKAFRAENVEAALVGTTGTEADIKKAAALLGDVEEANSDLHASAGYRKHMATVYAARALRIALSRAA